MTARRVPAGSLVPALLVLGFVLCEIVLAPTSAAAGVSLAPAGRSARDAAAADDPAAVAALRRAVEVTPALAYRGTQLHGAWPRGSDPATLLLAVRQDTGGRVATDIARSGEGAGSATAAFPDAGMSLKALLALEAAYRLRTAGTGSVAGRPATVVAAERAGGTAKGTEASRFWLDADTGLVLRQDVRDADGRLLRVSVFLDIEMLPPPDRVAGPVGSTRPGAVATPVTRTVPVPTDRGSSPACPDVIGCPALQLPGFDLLDGPTTEVLGSSTAVRTTYGDGLSVISVFVQRGRLDPARLVGMRPRPSGTEYVRNGWPRVLLWQADDVVITVVSDAPEVELDAALGALPRPTRVEDGTAVATLRRGLRSVLDWLLGS